MADARPSFSVSIAHLGGGPVSDVVIAKRDPEAAGPALCVVKRLKLGADADTAIAAQFMAEARLATRLHHAAIAEAFEAGEDAEGPFLVLEYLEGQTLARVRSRAHRRKVGISRGVALHIVIAVADGLAYAHALKDDKGRALDVVHRDLTPDNVVLTYGGKTKLVDFRMAVRSESAETRASVAYLAPEQASGKISVDARADLFALGVILWELLAGKRMWEAMTEPAVLARLTGDTPLPPLKSVVPDMPGALDALCAKALATVRDDRFESAAELRDALRAAAKELKLEATNAEVADLVLSLFDDERTKMQGVVDEALLRPAGGASSIPRLRPLPPTSSNKLVDVETDPRLWVGPPKPAAPAPPPTVQLQLIEVAKAEPPRSDRRFAILVAAAVVALLGGVAVYALTAKPDVKADDAPLPLPTRPTATVSAEPSALPEAQEIAVDISVRPTNAKLSVDGLKQPNPYHTKVAPGKFAHEIRAEAEGYEPQITTGVLFDRDRSIEIALVGKKPFVVAPPVVKPDAAAP